MVITVSVGQCLVEGRLLFECFGKDFLELCRNLNKVNGDVNRVDS